MKKQQGFTLIELMIVVAIIGVLSAIAVPAYQNYVKKSEAASAIGTLRSLQTNIDLYEQEQGSFPGTTNLGAIGAAGDMNALGAITLVPNAAASAGGTATFTFAATGPALKTKTIVYTKSTTGWKCKNNTGVDITSCAK